MPNYRLNNRHSELPIRQFFNTRKTDLSQSADEKIKLSQGYILQENISNELLKDVFLSNEKDFFDSMELVYLDKNEYLYQPHDEVSHLYFPESAVVSEFQILENGKTVEVSMIGREGVIGVHSILASQPAQSFSQVLIPGRAFRVNSQFVQRRIENCKYFQKNVFNFINRYISQISQRVVCSNHHSTEERLCLWLMMITERCEKTALPLTQDQIARFLGVHRPSVTLITQSLRNKKIIDYVRGKIFIIDKEKLNDSACDCYLTMRNL